MGQPLFDLAAYPSHRPTSSSSHYYHIQLLITLCQDLLCSTIIVGQRVAWVTILDTHTHTHTHTQTNKHTRCSEGKEARSIVVHKQSMLHLVQNVRVWYFILQSPCNANVGLWQQLTHTHTHTHTHTYARSASLHMSLHCYYIIIPGVL